MGAVVRPNWHERLTIGAFMGRKSLIVLYSVFLGSAGGCASAISPSNDGPPQGSPPNYRAIIAKNLIAKRSSPTGGFSPSNEIFYFRNREGIFQADIKIDHVEISDTIRMVQTNLYGWAWEACIRLNVNNSPVTYAVFISDGGIVDARAAVLTDNCGSDNYAPLDVRDARVVPANRAARKIGK